MIREREQKKEKVEFTFIGFREAKIAHAALKRRTARSRSASRPSTSPRPRTPTGQVIDGDPKTVRTVNDVWTFTRDVRSGDPNWTIVATHGEDA